MTFPKSLKYVAASLIALAVLGAAALPSSGGGAELALGPICITAGGEQGGVKAELRKGTDFRLTVTPGRKLRINFK